MIPMDRKGSVLIVEEDVFVRSVLTVALAEEGYRVIEAGTGKGAVAVLRDERPQVVFLDPQLPDMDGFEISRMIRDERRLSGVLVVVVSGRAGMLDKLNGFLTGAKAFIEMPFLAEDLVDKVEFFSRQMEFAWKKSRPSQAAS